MAALRINPSRGVPAPQPPLGTAPQSQSYSVGRRCRATGAALLMIAFTPGMVVAAMRRDTFLSDRSLVDGYQEKKLSAPFLSDRSLVDGYQEKKLSAPDAGKSSVAGGFFDREDQERPASAKALAEVASKASGVEAETSISEVADLAKMLYDESQESQVDSLSKEISSRAVIEELGGIKASTGLSSSEGFGLVRQSAFACTNSVQVVVVVDAGSTATRGNLLSYSTEWCPRKGRKSFLDTLTHWGEGKKATGMRRAIHDFIQEHFGAEYEATAEQDAFLASNTEQLKSVAAQTVKTVLTSMEELMEKHLSPDELGDAKIAGVPVFVHSTGGVRDLQGRLREVFFIALINSIMNYRSKIGVQFFTTANLAKPISGSDEGVYAWLTPNHYMGKLGKLRDLSSQLEPYPSRYAEVAREYDNLVGIVEIGGASAQIVFPVNPNRILPSFVKLIDLQAEGYLPNTYPKISLLAVSFMQHGFTSATGLILKSYCEDPKNLTKDGVCKFPCFNPGFVQPCSSEYVKFENGAAVLTGENRLLPVASFCDGKTNEIRLKALNRLLCSAARLDAEIPLAKRMMIRGCTKIEGTGDFTSCEKAMDQYLVNRSLPFPANAEATGYGFDNPKQIFEFVPSDATLIVTGAGMVKPISLLQEHQFLPEEFKGEPDLLAEAGERFCRSPLVTKSSAKDGSNLGQSGVAFHLPKGFVPLNPMNYATCLNLAYAQVVLKALNSSLPHPATVLFKGEMTDVVTDSKISNPSFGWASGVVLSNVCNGSMRLVMEGGPLHKASYTRTLEQ